MLMLAVLLLLPTAAAAGAEGSQDARSSTIGLWQKALLRRAEAYTELGQHKEAWQVGDCSIIGQLAWTSACVLFLQEFCTWHSCKPIMQLPVVSKE
jgi:hypothetical protein